MEDIRKLDTRQRKVIMEMLMEGVIQQLMRPDLQRYAEGVRKWKESRKELINNGIHP